jgi:hypothetical protein
MTTELAQLDCRHLGEVYEGHATGGCCGVDLVEVGNCKLLGSCTIKGGEVDHRNTVSCFICRHKEPKE